jgi:hypothetical protein
MQLQNQRQKLAHLLRQLQYQSMVFSTAIKLAKEFVLENQIECLRAHVLKHMNGRSST